MFVPHMLNGTLVGTNLSAVQLSLPHRAALRPAERLDHGTVLSTALMAELKALHGVPSVS